MLYACLAPAWCLVNGGRPTPLLSGLGQAWFSSGWAKLIQPGSVRGGRGGPFLC